MKKKFDMWAYKGMICYKKELLINLNEIESAELIELIQENGCLVHMTFISTRHITKRFINRKEAEIFIEDLLGFFSVSFDVDEE